jgi:hypothetical protein
MTVDVYQTSVYFISPHVGQGLVEMSASTRVLEGIFKELALYLSWLVTSLGLFWQETEQADSVWAAW